VDTSAKPAISPEKFRRSRGFASKVRQFNVSFTPGLSPVIGDWAKVAKPF